MSSIYLLTDQQEQELDQINDTCDCKVIVCDYGSGKCLEASFLDKSGYEAHTTWFNSKDLEQAELPTIEL